MDAVPFHPALVHVPLGLAIVLPFVGFGVLLASRRQWLPFRTWGVVLFLQVVTTASGVLAMRTGEAEEELLEGQIPDEALERHEELAEQFVWAMAASTALGAGALLLQATPAGPWLALASTTGTGAAVGLGIRAGASGGELVYRHGAADARRIPATDRQSNPNGHED
ncbi:MAG: hypothetical protein VKP57_00475 [Candidatus Sericytochromatia bacterium]|nr:hypothetical protein [Candidatus Sericytochromatia bacterium]